MKTDKFCIILPCLCLCIGVLSAGCKSNKDDVPQLTASEKQKIAEQQRQTGIQMQIYQIEKSNLSPEQKERLKNQVLASAKK